MSWIVIKEKNNKIELISDSQIDGKLPKGSFLTVEDKDSKFILRVDETRQLEQYSPSPLLIEMNLPALNDEKLCKNIVYAHRIKDITNRGDGLIDFIKPQLKARRSTQKEIEKAINNSGKGPKVFISTIHAGENKLLLDNNRNFVTANIPEDSFYHQMLICGKTGSGKTVAMKYLAQYFCEEMNGAVLAINVKEKDFLKMNEPSVTFNSNVQKEWNELGKDAHGMSSYKIYYPASVSNSFSYDLNNPLYEKITLNVKDLDPESLIGLLRGVTDVASQNLPNIFRAWKFKEKRGLTFRNFIDYFKTAENSELEFDTMNSRNEESKIKMHRGTYSSVLRKLDNASIFFDNPNSKFLDSSDILVPGKMSIIDIANKNGKEFGAILLRQLLSELVEAKGSGEYKTPLLVIIDEVHVFYGDNSTEEALGELDTICRTGRSMKIGVIFASQNINDVPSGISKVVNSKIFFRSDSFSAKSSGIDLDKYEIESLGKGFAGVSIHDLSQVKSIKFPLAYAGVIEENKNE